MANPDAAQIVNLARNVLLSRARSELAMVADLCQHDIGRLYGRKTIGARDMIDLLGACLQEQAVIEYLVRPPRSARPAFLVLTTGAPGYSAAGEGGRHHSAKRV